jgi:hypothetical protein
MPGAPVMSSLQSGVVGGAPVIAQLVCSALPFYMRAFGESFQRALGKGAAQLVLSASTLLFAVAAGVVRGEPSIARILLLCLAAASALGLATSLVLRLVSYRKQRREIEDLKNRLRRAEFLIKFQDIVYRKDRPK